MYIQKWNCWIIWNFNFIFIFYMGGPYCFSQWLDHFTSSLKVHEGSSLSTSTLTLVFVVFCFLYWTCIIMGMRWCLTVVLICVSLMIGNVECLFVCPLAVCVSSLGSLLFRSSVHLQSDDLFLLPSHTITCTTVPFMGWSQVHAGKMANQLANVGRLCPPRDVLSSGKTPESRHCRYILISFRPCNFPHHC